MSQPLYEANRAAAWSEVVGQDQALNQIAALRKLSGGSLQGQCFKKPLVALVFRRHVVPALAGQPRQCVYAITAALGYLL